VDLVLGGVTDAQPGQARTPPHDPEESKAKGGRQPWPTTCKPHGVTPHQVVLPVSRADEPTARAAATVAAWRVAEGDISPSGAVVTSVQRDPARAHVRIGFSDGTALDVAGERRVVVIAESAPRVMAIIQTARRAHQLFHTGSR